MKKGITHQYHCSFALTEKEIGSDATALECTATRVGGGYLLNGNKRWIGIAPHSDLIVTFAKDD